MTETTTIDEDNLRLNCDSLEALAADYRAKLDITENLCRTLRSIQRVETGVNPSDERTGAPMTDATRLEIYIAGVAKAATLLGLTSEEEDDD